MPKEALAKAPTSAVVATAAMVASAAPTDAYTGAVDALPSAFAAYGHFLGLVLVAMSLAAERVLIKPGMSDEDEEKMANADILYGIAGVLVLATGYFRVTEFGELVKTLFTTHTQNDVVGVCFFKAKGGTSTATAQCFG